ncbi:unnamed protein product [Heligmosomoides polygyrus]|uniref:Fibronectin type-III domain-containing protein n=1 Tax=Heligmosomoides polygyrus TaxID=6339 RepID=A0A3P8AJI5_HELPZ|nr:unnamed protein product [Heligmosomoides polygyrus]
METKMLRWTVGVKRLDCVRNDAIRQRFGVAPISDKLREARLLCPWKAARGRPKQRWQDTLHLDLKMACVHPVQAFDRENRIGLASPHEERTSPPRGTDANENDNTLTITPGAEYTASVRVCWHNVCSPFVNVINTAFVTLKYPPIAFLKRSNEATTAFDLLGDEMQWDAITSVFQPCCDGIMSFDNTTKTLYSLDSNEGNVIYRRPGEPMEANPFTSFLSVKFLTVLASRASLVLASSYQIISYRLTGTLEHMIYTCSSPYDDCAEVIGLSSDDVSGEIHFLAQPEITIS